MTQKTDIQPKWLIKGNYKISLDKYYTKNEIANYCYLLFLDFLKKHHINPEKFIFLEPSAGNGSFYNLFPNHQRIGIDIMPEQENIIQSDFFDWKPDKTKTYLTIGNPPFGIRGWLALEFINKAALFSDFVAFILPMYFNSDGKGSAKLRVKGLDLLFTQELPPDIFYKENEKISINTVFQIWRKSKPSKVPTVKNPDLKNLVEIYTVCSYPKRRCGLDKLDRYDCFIASTFYNKIKLVNHFGDVQYGSGYGIIIKKYKKEILTILEQTNWFQYSSKATNHCNHINKKHIVDSLNDHPLFKKIYTHERKRITPFNYEPTLFNSK